MIPLPLSRALSDPRMKHQPAFRVALAYLYGELHFDRYASVKVSSLAHGAQMSRTRAFLALAELERLGYLEADPTMHKPKHYRLANPACPAHETRRAA